MSKLINENRLFSHVVPNLGKRSRIIEETIENSIRSNSNVVHIELSKSEQSATLTITNDGDVLEDFSPLLTLAQSSYNEEIMKSHQPAGIGIMMMLAASKSIFFESGNKSLTVISDMFFSDASYRENILNEVVETQHYFNGFLIRLDIDGDVGFIENYFRKNCDQEFVHSKQLGYYEIEIYYNSFPVKKMEINSHAKIFGTGVLSGMEISILDEVHIYQKKSGVLWHGKHIYAKELFPFLLTPIKGAAVDCVSPRFPDRTELINTEHELRMIKKECERQIFKKFNGFLKGVTSFSHQILNALEDSNYDVEHFNEWHDISAEANYKILFGPKAKANYSVITEDSRSYLDPSFKDEVKILDFGEAPITRVSKIDSGGTTPPSWYSKILHKDDFEIVIHSSKKIIAASYASTYCDINPVNNITISEFSIGGVVSYEDNVYINMNSEEEVLYELAIYNSDARFSSYDDEMDQLNESYDRVLDALDCSVNINDVLNRIRNILKISL
jgi:hypothetical protein